VSNYVISVSAICRALILATCSHITDKCAQPGFHILTKFKSLFCSHKTTACAKLTRSPARTRSRTHLSTQLHTHRHIHTYTHTNTHAHTHNTHTQHTQHVKKHKDTYTHNTRTHTHTHNTHSYNRMNEERLEGLQWLSRYLAGKRGKGWIWNDEMKALAELRRRGIECVVHHGACWLLCAGC